LLVTFLLPSSAGQATRFGPVAEIPLALLGVRLDNTVPAKFMRILARIHGVVVGIWALFPVVPMVPVVHAVALAPCPPEQIAPLIV
jgi:hypothetical protein